MRKTTRFLSLLMALAMIAAMMVMPAMAADTTYTVKVTHEADGHQFSAYQLFTGDLSDSILSNIQWGTGIDGEAFLAALKADTTKITNGVDTVTMAGLFANCTTAAQVANVLKDFTSNGDRLERFAKIAADHLTSPAGVSGEAVKTADGYEYTISGEGMTAGYYLIEDTSAQMGANDFQTHFILAVVKDTSVTTKGDVPYPQKTVGETLDGTYSEYITNMLYKPFYFKVDVSLAADLHEYDEYFLNIIDTMSKGIEYLGLEEVYVLRGDNSRTYLAKEGQWIIGEGQYAVSVAEVENGETTITINFPNILNMSYDDNGTQHKIVLNGEESIVVKYQAQLTDEAVIGNLNENEVYIEFTNGPRPDQGGISLPDYAWVFPFGLKVNKVDADNREVMLPGAEFVLYHIHGEDEKMYAVVVDGKIDHWTNNVNEATTLVTDSNGQIIVDGLDDNQMYYLHETKAPEGYNKLFSDVQFILYADIRTGSDGIPYVNGIEYYVDGQQFITNSGTDFEAGRIVVTVLNDKGNTLPSTGGIGTTLFYVFGGLMVAGAAVLLITKKRMAA